MPTLSNATIELPLNRPADAKLAADIEKQSAYVSPLIVSLRVTEGGTAVVAECNASGAVLDDIVGKLARFLDAISRNFRQIERRVLFERTGHPIRAGGSRIHDAFRARGWMFEHGHGQVSLSGPPLRALDALDRRLVEIYTRDFAAVDQLYPAMIKAELLARCGYFEMHPNIVSFVSHVVEDYDTLEDFRRANAGQSTLIVAGDRPFALPKYCLNPAACFPCYEALEGKTLPSPGLTLTWRGRVFRYESRNIAGLDRLWEFNVRELVFLGTEDFVERQREQALRVTMALAEEWDLDCGIETATDPFFAPVYGAKTLWQHMMDAKHEVRAKLDESDGDSRTVAAGSFNRHGTFFGDRFHIADADGKAATSACVGFGLERLMFALFAQHGLEASAWPAALRNAVFH